MLAVGAALWRKAWFHAEHLHQKRQLVGGFFDLLGGRLAGAVTGFHLDADQHGGRAGVGRL